MQTSACISQNFIELRHDSTCYDESRGSIDGEGEERSSSSGIHVPLRHGRKPLVEVLEHEPVFHSMVQTGLDVILQPLPCLEMDSIEVCWEFEIFPLRALVLPMGKNFTRNAMEHLSHMLIASFSL